MKIILSIVMTFCTISMMAVAGGGNEEKTSTMVQVIDSDTGEPIIGADIHVVGVEEVFYTDPDGFVEIEHLLDSELSFTVSYISYEDVTSSVGNALTEVVVTLQGRQ